MTPQNHIRLSPALSVQFLPPHSISILSDSYTERDPRPVITRPRRYLDPRYKLSLRVKVIIVALAVICFVCFVSFLAHLIVHNFPADDGISFASIGKKEGDDQEFDLRYLYKFRKNRPISPHWLIKTHIRKNY